MVTHLEQDIDIKNDDMNEQEDDTNLELLNDDLQTHGNGDEMILKVTIIIHLILMTQLIQI